MQALSWVRKPQLSQAKQALSDFTVIVGHNVNCTSVVAKLFLAIGKVESSILLSQHCKQPKSAEQPVKSM
jgi:hypothetical protein